MEEILPNNIDLYCIPNIFISPERIKKIQSENFLYIDYFKLLAKEYDFLKKYYLRLMDNNQKVNLLPTSGVSCILFALLLTNSNNIKIYDMTLYNHGDKGIKIKYHFPHKYELDYMILNKIGYDYKNNVWVK